MKFKKYLLVFSKVTIVSLIPAYRIWSLTRPSLGTLLKREGYRTIFDSERPTFDKWLKLYSFFKEDLISNNIVVDNLTSDSEGASLFKNWCAKSLETNSNNLLDKVKKYCTLNLEVYALEREGAKLIQDINERKQREVWFYVFEKHKEEIIRSGFFSGIMIEPNADKLKAWCNKNSKKMYISKNYAVAEYFSTWCTIDEKEFNSF